MLTHFDVPVIDLPLVYKSTKQTVKGNEQEKYLRCMVGMSLKRATV